MGAEHAEGHKRRLPAFVELVVLVLAALLISIGIKSFFVQMFFVPSGSMEPLFVENDRILVQKVSYWTQGVQRGDVVVFEDPGGWLPPTEDLTGLQKLLSEVGLFPTGGHLVKRVIGVGGDVVACCDARGRVTVNGVALKERDYLKNGIAPSDKRFTVLVPEGRLWVMGDNRSNSEDSRYHRDLPGKGSIPENGVVGKVWAVVWPLGRFEIVKRPETFNQIELQISEPGSTEPPHAALQRSGAAALP